LVNVLDPIGKSLGPYGAAIISKCGGGTLVESSPGVVLIADENDVKPEQIVDQIGMAPR
jgi:hypothetical protein